jgi:hypothetical protein
MYFTNSGGDQWTTGITATGINAKAITTGSLNTGLINIYNGAQKSFIWNSEGLNAYHTSDGVYNMNKFIRFNQFGIFGIDNEKNESLDLDSIQDIKDEASFYLGYDGLIIRSGLIEIGEITRDENNQIIVPISQDYKPYVAIDSTGLVQCNEIVAGCWNINGYKGLYASTIKDELAENGQLIEHTVFL